MKALQALVEYNYRWEIEVLHSLNFVLLPPHLSSAWIVGYTEVADAALVAVSTSIRRDPGEPVGAASGPLLISSEKNTRTSQTGDSWRHRRKPIAGPMG